MLKFPLTLLHAVNTCNVITLLQKHSLAFKSAPISHLDGEILAKRTPYSEEVNVKVKLSLRLIKHHSIKAYWGVNIQSYPQHGGE